MNIPIGENIFKPRRIIFLYFSIIFFAIGIVFKSVLTNQWYAGFITLGIMFGIMGLIIYVANFKSYLLINDEGIRHKTLLSNRFVSWDEITGAHHHFIWEGKQMYNEFAITTLNSATSFQIRTGYYSRKTLQQICSLLSIKLSLKINTKISEMAEGKFAWYVF